MKNGEVNRYETRSLKEDGEIVTEHRLVRPKGQSTAFLRLDLNFFATFSPDWLLLMFYLFRHTAMNGKPESGEIKLAARFWKLAGIDSKERRRKVLDHIEDKVPPSVVRLERARGRCARVVLGPEWP